ncbi:MAG: sulfur oxidation c-type cytochrome SoxA [Pseudomonadota bacterium]
MPTIVAAETKSFAARPDLATDVVRSGITFLNKQTQTLQEDAFANPGYLWVDQGEHLFNEPDNPNSCRSCHNPRGDLPLAGAAATYPKYDVQAQRLLNLEGRINQCRRLHQQRPMLAYESEELLSLTAYIATLSRDKPIKVSITGPAASYFATGRDYFFQRKGQFNLACNQCHDEHWGKRLRGDTISQGHGNGFPAYRLEWQTLGSLHRRLRDCDQGIRAEPFAAGSDLYLSLELYLAWRARNLVIEAPGVRR